MASPLRLFLLLCIFRVLNVFLIQSYFDPDEFWQTMEPAYCTVFRPSQGFDCPGFTWEWKRRAPDPSASWIEQGLLGPARTYLSVLPTHVFYQVLKTLELDSTWMVGRGPMLLYAITVAAPTDLAVWGCAHRLYPHSSSPAIVAWCLVASLSAWFHAFSLVRTFANGQETVLLMASLVLVSPELLGPRSGPAEQSSGRILRTCGAFLLGGMSVSIRGTAVAAFVPMGILLALQETSWIRKICYLFFPCALFGLLGIGVALLVDYWFFAFPALPFLGNFHFNVLLDNATLFGTHPWHWYFSAGIPAITGVLLPLLIMDLVAGCWSSGRRNLWIIVGTYVVALSMNQHKGMYILLLLRKIYSRQPLTQAHQQNSVTFSQCSPFFVSWRVRGCTHCWDKTRRGRSCDPLVWPFLRLPTWWRCSI
jgi:phosphatidylinositol glycan class B